MAAAAAVSRAAFRGDHLAIILAVPAAATVKVLKYAAASFRTEGAGGPGPPAKLGLDTVHCGKLYENTAR